MLTTRAGPKSLTTAAALLWVPLLLVSTLASAAASECPYTPAVGSAERRAIMDAWRKPAMDELNQKVAFVAHKFAACRGWAFIEAAPQQPGDRPVDWSITPYRDAVAEGMCGGFVHALLRKDGGQWRVRAHEICATDVPWVSWDEEHSAPSQIFPSLE